jgi:hypothetical protein
MRENKRPVLAYDRKGPSLEVPDPELASFLGRIYREQPYLEGASRPALKSRVRGLVRLLATQQFGTLPELVVSNGPDEIALLDAVEELRWRGIDPLGEIHAHMAELSDEVPFLDDEEPVRRLFQYKGKPVLFKYTPRRYVDDFVTGSVRLKAASSYDNPSFSSAIRDDELQIAHELRGLKVTTQAGAEIPVIGNRLVTSAASDYYISSFSVVFEPKLFTFFGDACIAILNPDGFLASLRKAHDSLMPDFIMAHHQVEYIDRFRKLLRKQPIEFRKSSDFAYEYEYRVASFAADASACLDELRILTLKSAEMESLVVTTHT